MLKGLLETARLFIGGLSWQWKLGGALLGVALLSAVVWGWGNKQYYAGKDAGRFELINEVNDQITAENKEERERLALQAEEIGRQWAALDAAQQTLDEDRANVGNMLEVTRAQIQTTYREDTVRVTQIPDSELNSAVRNQLQRLSGSAVDGQ